MNGLGLNSFIRSNVPEIVIDCFDIVLFVSIFLYLLPKVAPVLRTWGMNKKIKEKWSNSPKDVVIFHSLARGINVPDISPFALKLETYLRMAKIPYQFDGAFPLGAKGKTPWITLNGKHIADSQMIIDLLNRKFDVNLGKYNKTEKAHGRAARLMVEEHLYWCGVVWRFRYCDRKLLEKMYFPLLKKFNWLLRKIIWRSILSKFNEMAWHQGTGRHSYEEVVSMTSESMQTLSTIIGTNKFLLGDEPSEDDAGVFGLLAVALYSSPGAPTHDDFARYPNLLEYTKRMRDRFWPDWNDLLSSSTS